MNITGTEVWKSENELWVLTVTEMELLLYSKQDIAVYRVLSRKREALFIVQ
ncbi:hypothetical protein [Bacillus toyonensis]|uniref:hypothetical protein n=1 Tax=Bacillus toyonensis TaxID=155322 RepID=UPI002E1F2149|nr:hypothetical protein [Bacillus toyonensis]